MWRAILGHSLLFLVGLCGLVTSARANETQTENANPGTTAWQITSPAYHREIEGYASLTSVNVGGSISFFVSTGDSTYTMDFYRIGWYGGAGGRELLGPISLPGSVQPTPSPDAYGDIECNWTASYALTVPTNWVSGVYLVKLTGATSGAQAYIQFVVREDSRNSAYLFQRSITTDEAFNDWPGISNGGESLYTNPAAVKVSFNRPYGIDESYWNTHNGAGFFLRWEVNMVRWLEMNGYDVSYATNIDVHENPNLLSPHKAFLSVGHDEYWSWQMRQNVEAARDAGVGLGFFAANESYWQMRLEPSTISGAIDRTMVAYKSSSDPTTNPCLITILWRQNTCEPSEQSLIGVESTGYDINGNNGDIVITDPSNWALAGTGLVSGSTIQSSIGPDADGIVQTDSPAGITVIAHSPLPSGYLSDSNPYPAYPYSDMVTYTAASGATVFAASTEKWSWTLDDWSAPTQRPSILNTAAQQITQNVLARLVTLVSPTVYIDTPRPSATVSGIVTISGWAVDNDPSSETAISSVQVKVDGTVVGTANYGSSRPDVCAVYPGRPGCPNVGYSYSLNTSSLSVGTHTITVTATDSDTAADTGSANVSVNVHATPPTVYIDTPAAGSTVSGIVAISGWAIDNAAAVGTAISNVQVNVDGIVVGTATYGLSRPDVCAVYPGRPSCPNVGYTYSLDTSTLISGTHTITVTATDSDATPDAGSSSVIREYNFLKGASQPPTVYIDTPTAGSTVSGMVAISGWAIDNAAAVGTAISDVQVKVDGTVVGTATYGLSRPDVCAVYPGRPFCPNVGYSYSLNTSTLSVGTHTITVLATDSDTTPDTGSASVTVNVQATPPTVYIDAPAAGSNVSGTVTVSGWAVDNAASVGTAISSVQVRVDGTVVGTATYGLSRPDVCTALSRQAWLSERGLFLFSEHIHIERGESHYHGNSDR